LARTLYEHSRAQTIFVESWNAARLPPPGERLGMGGAQACHLGDVHENQADCRISARRRPGRARASGDACPFRSTSRCVHRPGLWRMRTLWPQRPLRRLPPGRPVGRISLGPSMPPWFPSRPLWAPLLAELISAQTIEKASRLSSYKDAKAARKGAERRNPCSRRDCAKRADGVFTLRFVRGKPAGNRRSLKDFAHGLCVSIA
jgi:hypothetical protein